MHGSASGVVGRLIFTTVRIAGPNYRQMLAGCYRKKYLRATSRLLALTQGLSGPREP